MIRLGKVTYKCTSRLLFPSNTANASQNLLREYGQLLDDYKVLKKAYEEKGTTNAHVAKAVATPVVPTVTASKPPRNPYVLVLVDGNNYIVSRVPFPLVTPYI
jgi:hypothetical protein